MYRHPQTAALIKEPGISLANIKLVCLWLHRVNFHEYFSIDDPVCPDENYMVGSRLQNKRAANAATAEQKKKSVSGFLAGLDHAHTLSDEGCLGWRCISLFPLQR